MMPLRKARTSRSMSTRSPAAPANIKAPAAAARMNGESLTDALCGGRYKGKLELP